MVPIRRMTRMRKVRNLSANDRGNRRTHVLRTVEALESRCVLNAAPLMLFGAPPQPGGSSLHSDYGEYAAGPRGATDPHFSLSGGAATALQDSVPTFAEPPNAGPLSGFPSYEVAGGGLQGPDPLTVARVDLGMTPPMGVIDIV